MKTNKQNITDRKPTLVEKFLMWFLPLILTFIQRVYCMTFRRVDIGRETVDSLHREQKPWIYGTWHCNVLFTPYFMRNQNVYALVSDSKDGEMITRVLYRFGNKAIRGSSSKGGMKALRQMITTLKKGQPIGVTPDGPRGPALIVKEGIIQASRLSGAPIIPFFYAATKQWNVEKSWDRHIIPKPFSTVVVSFGEPIDVKKLSQNKNGEQLMQEVQKLFLENMEHCYSKIRDIQNR